MNKLILIIDGKKQEYLIDGLEVAYGLYEEADVAILVHLHKKEIHEAEGIAKPSSKGIYSESYESFESVFLKNTLYNDEFKDKRKFHAFKIITEISPDFKFIEKFELSTHTWKLEDAGRCLEELVISEKQLAEKYYLKIVEDAKMHFVVNSDQLYITENVEIYKKEVKIEEVKIGEIK